MTKGWCARVTVFKDLVVSISERELCGRDLSEADADVIRGCARHLLAFVGDARSASFNGDQHASSKSVGAIDPIDGSEGTTSTRDKDTSDV